jgi:hypothetical protein
MFEQQDLRMLQYVPHLSNMYKWATNAFAFRYSSKNLEEQASEYLEDAIQKLPSGEKEKGMRIFKDFLRCWHELQRHFENYMQCNGEIAENSPIPPFVSKVDDPDSDLPFLRVQDVVSLRSDENEFGLGGGCHLIRMLKKLLQLQCDAMLLPELLAVIEAEGPDSVNPFGFYAQPFSSGFFLHISDIPTHEWERHLLGINDDCAPLLFAIISHSCVVHCAEGRRTHYDLKPITRLVLQSVVNGRFPLTMASSAASPSFYQTLKVKMPVELRDNEHDAQIVDVRELEQHARDRVGRLSGAIVDDPDLNLLYVHCVQLRAPWTNNLAPAEVMRLHNDISEMPGEHIAHVLQNLDKVVAFILRMDPKSGKSFKPDQLIGELIDSNEVCVPGGWSISFCRRFSCYRLEALRDIALKAIAGIPSRDFSNHCGLNDTMPEEERCRLQNIQSRMLQDQAERRFKYCEVLSCFASQLHGVIRRVSHHELPDQPLSGIEAVQEIFPRVHQNLSSGAGALAQGAAAVDDGALAKMVDFG